MDSLDISRRKKCKGCYPVVKLPDGDIYDLLKSASKSDNEEIVKMNKEYTRVSHVMD